MADSNAAAQQDGIQPASKTSDFYHNPKFPKEQFLNPENFYKTPSGVALGYLILYVSDQDRAIRFYSGLLGFELRIKHGKYWAELAAGTTTLALHLAEPKKEEGSGAAAAAPKEPTAGSASASFFVKDLKSFHERAVQFDGCKVVKEPVQQPWGGFQAHYADPDGLGFTVVELPSL